MGKFFDASDRVNKNRSSKYFYSIHTYICTVKYKAKDCEITSFVQSETRTMAIDSVNLSMYKIKRFLTLRSSYHGR